MLLLSTFNRVRNSTYTGIADKGKAISPNRLSCCPKDSYGELVETL